MEPSREQSGNPVLPILRFCTRCKEALPLHLVMLNPLTGKTVRLFQCKCGQNVWTTEATPRPNRADDQPGTRAH